MKTIKTTLALATLTLGTIGFTTQEAKAILLSDLLTGESITTGDTLIDNWSSIINSGVDITQIDVTAIDDTFLISGLKFTDLSGVLTADNDSIELSLLFDVSTISGDPLIFGTFVDATDTSFSGAGGAWAVASGATGLGTGIAFADNATGDFFPQTSYSFASQSSIFSSLVLQIVSDSPGNTTSLNMFEVRFQLVPEPLTMLGAGMAAGFGAFFKRKLDKNEKV